MSVEDFIPSESPEAGSGSAEISEKYQEAAKKAGAGIKRTQKDEGKAKKYDFLLANFLVQMILEKKYDDLLDRLFVCFDEGYGTNFLLGILSLVYLPISDEIRKFAGKTPIIFEYEPTAEMIPFDDNTLPPMIRKRVNQWIEDMETVMRLEASVIVSQRTLGKMLYGDAIRDFTRQVFQFFFAENNIDISEQKAKNYSEFILGEIQKNLKGFFEEMMQQEEWKGEEI